MGAYTKRAFVAVATSICVLAGTAQGAFAASGTAKANRDIVEDASAQASADGRASHHRHGQSKKWMRLVRRG